MSKAYVAVASSNPTDGGPGGTVNDAGIVVDAYAGVELNTYASASLTLATPCDLAFDDLVELNSLGTGSTSSLSVNGASFVASGGEMVAVVQSVVGTSTPNGNYCSTDFSIELYVNTSNLADYGVRNYTVVHPDAGYYDPQCPR